MTPIERIPDDYEPQEFEQFPDGNVAISGIRWFTLDDDQMPMFVVQTGGGTQRMTARYRGIQTNGEDGPPASIDRGQLPFLVKAFGADPAELPGYNQSQARLEVAQRLINAAGTEVIVNVRDGWIQWFPGTELPPGYYRFVYRGCLTRNQLGEPSWKEGQYGPYSMLQMECVSDSVGNPTAWDKCKVLERMNYALEVEDGQMMWTKTPQGSFTAAAVYMQNFMVATCGPDILDEGFDNIENVMPEVDRAAKEQARVLMGVVERSTRGRKRCILRLGQLVPVPEKQETLATATTPADPLTDVLNEQFEGKAFSADGKLSDDAKAWLRGFKGTDPADGEEVTGIATFCDKHSIPKGFKRMSAENVDQILAWMGREEVTVSDGGGEDEF
jgi:hypothetical protein